MEAEAKKAKKAPGSLTQAIAAPLPLPRFQWPQSLVGWRGVCLMLDSITRLHMPALSTALQLFSLARARADVVPALCAACCVCIVTAVHCNKAHLQCNAGRPACVFLFCARAGQGQPRAGAVRQVPALHAADHEEGLPGAAGARHRGRRRGAAAAGPTRIAAGAGPRERLCDGWMLLRMQACNHPPCDARACMHVHPAHRPSPPAAPQRHALRWWPPPHARC